MKPKLDYNREDLLMVIEGDYFCRLCEGRNPKKIVHEKNCPLHDETVTGISVMRQRRETKPRFVPPCGSGVGPCNECADAIVCDELRAKTQMSDEKRVFYLRNRLNPLGIFLLHVPGDQIRVTGPGSLQRIFCNLDAVEKWMNEWLSDINLELKNLMAKKEGNKELALFSNMEGNNEIWSLHLGNPTNCVALGEISGELVTSGKTIEEAIIAMKAKLEE